MRMSQGDQPGTDRAPLRVAIADDSPLFTSGLELLLAAEGVNVLYTVRTGAALLARLHGDEVPDIVIMDIEMSADQRDEGLVTARELRRCGVTVPILILSSHLRESDALAFLTEGHEQIGFLSKDGAVNLDKLLDAFNRLRAGEPVVDDQLVNLLIRRPRVARRLNDLTNREREVLSLMAEGRSNNGIATALQLSERTIEGYVANVFDKLELERDATNHARVRAVLTWLSMRRLL